ncbi:tRNA (N(6)-L-threonylcarbamoyladenosine(37)-C(2))-methylthiotransferase MtaB, partial [Bacillus haynesii]|uniref:tRNA (N(6)-L-threonylcarbamoyladenosine(37)-C(2))- methylthiotransferase MtaB n=1 Tax=Bacillus haynesii TaxID=1925021 RepID=UPI0022824D88
GCYAQTSPAEIMAIPGVDIVVGTQDREKMLGFIKQYQEERQPINGVSNIMKARVFEELDVPAFTDRTRASLKIQEGCNNFCTFCIIPWARGLLRSRDPEEVIRQAQQLVDAGYKEIVLTGIHTGGYGEDMKDYNFAQLLKELDSRVKGLKRIRISSIEASQITDEVIEVLDRSDKIVRHLHIPLQSGSNSVLKRMRRKYTMEFFADRLTKLKKALPGLAVTSDVIVGFPGETEEEFMETYNFIKEHKFSELHVFPYSKRTGTPAARMDDQVDENVKNERVHKLIALSDQLAKEYASDYEGDVLEIIPEEPFTETGEDNLFVGYTDNYMKVVFEGSEDLIGQLVKVKILKEGYPYNKGQFVRVAEDDVHENIRLSS